MTETLKIFAQKIADGIINDPPLLKVLRKNRDKSAIDDWLAAIKKANHLRAKRALKKIDSSPDRVAALQKILDDLEDETEEKWMWR